MFTTKLSVHNHYGDDNCSNMYECASFLHICTNNSWMRGISMRNVLLCSLRIFIKHWYKCCWCRVHHSLHTASHRYTVTLVHFHICRRTKCELNVETISILERYFIDSCMKTISWSIALHSTTNCEWHKMADSWPLVEEWGSNPTRPGCDGWD